MPKKRLFPNKINFPKKVKNGRPLLFVGIILIALLVGIVVIQTSLKKESKAAWWNGDYKYRTAYSFTATNAVASERKVKIDVDTQTLISAGKVQSDCDDIRFTAADGKVLDYFIDTNTQDCNTNSTDFYVKVPSVAAGGNLIYMYYGNSSIARSDFGGRKNDFFDETGTSTALKGYWKMNETSANTCTGGTNDSCDSALTNDGAWNGNATTTTTAKLGGRATTYDGTTDYVSVSPVTSLTTNYTFSAWVYWPTGATGYDTIYDSGTGSNKWYISLSTTDTVTFTEENQFNYFSTGTISRDSWHHIAIVKSGDSGTNLTFYIDGSASGTAAVATTTTPSGSSTIGTRTDTGAGFEGQIDDLRLHATNLSANQISALYNSGNGQEINSVLTFTPSSGPTAASEETTPGPIAHWKFDEGQGQTVNDSTKHTNNGTLGANSSSSSDDPTWKQESDCVIGKCLQFDGTTDYVKIPDNSTIDLTGALSLSAWVKPTTISGTQQILSKFDNTTGNTQQAYRFYINSSGFLVANVFDNTTGGFLGRTMTTGALTANKWYFVHMTYDGTTTATGIKIYVNGNLATSSNTSSGSFTSLRNVSSNLHVGSEISSAGTLTLFFKGFIDEPKIYPYARSAAEVRADYSSGAAVLGLADQKDYLSDGLVGYWKLEETATPSIDSSGNANSGTWTGNATSASGKFGNAISLDGTGDYVNLGNINTLTGPFALSAWVNGSSSSRGIVGKRDNSNNGYILYNAGTACVYTNAANRCGATSINNSAWHHVVGTWDGTNLNIYVDGKLDNNTSSGTPVNPITNTANLEIGTYNDISTGFLGKIDEVRIYNRALSADEVRNLYNWTPAPVAYWNFDDGIGQSPVDISNGNTATLGATTSSSTDDPTWTNGKYGKGLSFDGDTDIVNIPDTDTIDFTASQDFSVSFWVKFDPGNTDGDAMVEKWNGSGNYPYAFRVFGTTRPRFVRYDGTNNPGVIGNTNISSGWHYITGIKSGTAMYLYVDGKLDNSTTDTTTGTTTNSSNLCIAQRCGTITQAFAGTIDDIKIYNYARTPGQIVEDMNASHPLSGSPIGSQTMYWKLDEQQGTTAQDSTNNNFDGTTSGVVWKTKKDCKVNGCLELDGTADFVNAGDLSFLDGATQMTITMWLNLTTTPGINSEILTKIGSSATSNSFSMRMGGATDEIALYVSNSVTDTIAGNGARTTNYDIPTGTWTHVAVVYDGNQSLANRIRFYKNGIGGFSVATPGTTPTSMTSGSTSNIKLGDGDYTTHTGAQAKYDEVKIYSAALTPDQIRIDMNAGGAISTSVFGSSEAADLTDGEGNPPVLEFNFDENTGQSTNDSSGNGNTGTLGASGAIASDDPSWIRVTGQPTHGNGIGGNALSFDGSNDRLAVADASSIQNIFGGHGTISMWVYRKGQGASPGNTRLLEKGSTGGWLIYDTGKIEQYYDSSFKAYTPATSIPLNTWTHYTIVYNSSSPSNTPTIYINGVSVSVSASGGSGSGSPLTDVGDTLYIGTNAGGDRTLDGHIDSMKIYNYARTASQVAYDYNRGKPVGHWKLDECQGSTVYDNSGKGNNGTITIGASGTQTAVGTCSTSSTAWGNGVSGKYSSSLKFDGNDDYIDIGTTSLFNITSSWTVSSWVKVNTFNTTSPFISTIVLRVPGGGNGNHNLGLQFGNGTLAGNDLFVAKFTDSGSTNRNAIGTNHRSTGTWYHVVGVFNTSTDTLTTYVNGIQEAQTTSLTNDPISLSANLQIGRDHTNGRYFNGQIDDVHVYNYAMSVNQIKKIYNEGGSVRFGN